MKQTKYLVKLTEIEKDDFGFFGNDCRYYLEVYSQDKVMVGTAMVSVVQCGTDYSEVADWIYDYDLADDEQRQELADLLGVESIDKDWLDEEGCIDIDKLPEEVSGRIYDNYDESLIDWYYEEFSEMADEEGFVSLDDFADTYSYRCYNNEIKKLDLTQSLNMMFEDGGWFAYACDETTERDESINILTADDKDMFVGLSVLITSELEDMDLVSSCVEIRYDCDYDKEDEAEDAVHATGVEMAYIIIRSMLPRLKVYDEEDWIDMVSDIFNNIAIRLGFVYNDNDSSLFSQTAEAVHDYLTGQNTQTVSSMSCYPEINALVNKLIDGGIYPMSDDVYNNLLSDRNIEL